MSRLCRKSTAYQLVELPLAGDQPLGLLGKNHSRPSIASATADPCATEEALAAGPVAVPGVGATSTRRIAVFRGAALVGSGIETRSSRPGPYRRVPSTNTDSPRPAPYRLPSPS